MSSSFRIPRRCWLFVSTANRKYTYFKLFAGIIKFFELHLVYVCYNACRKATNFLYRFIFNRWRLNWIFLNSIAMHFCTGKREWTFIMIIKKKNYLIKYIGNESLQSIKWKFETFFGIRQKTILFIWQHCGNTCLLLSPASRKLGTVLNCYQNPITKSPHRCRR